MKSTKRLTIGMPVYNDVQFIEESLQSILDQSFQDYLLVIVDDCSTDGSGEVCKKVADQHPNIQYFRNKENIGISKNMMGLLNHAQTPYFAWAGDDDIIHKEFFTELISLLEKDKDAVCAFSKYSIIDENGKPIKEINADYTSKKPLNRIRKLARTQDDGFGYGVFRTEKIRDTYFPTWWWPNKRSAYNNIFPSLCFYLSKGLYLHSEKNLFKKRIKTNKNVHHKTTGSGNAIKETLAFIIRRFNLVIVSTKMISKGAGIFMTIPSFFILNYYWFLKSSAKQIALASNAFWNNRVLKK
jgi:glycosyltransferase involved in cell wall biosynthesis